MNEIAQQLKKILDTIQIVWNKMQLDKKYTISP